MASTSSPVGKKRKIDNRRIWYKDVKGQRRYMRLPELNKRDLSAFKLRVRQLVSSQITGNPLDPDFLAWIDKLPDSIHDKLADRNLVPYRQRVTLGMAVEEYLRQMAEKKEPGTVKNNRSTLGKLAEHFGADCDLREISVADAEEWRELLASAHATSTVAAHVKRVKTFFRSAVKRSLCRTNPFADVLGGKEENDLRLRYAEIADVEKVIAIAPDTEFQLILALCRFGGLRHPSETMKLRWQDIDWGSDTQAGRIRVCSPKTKRQGKPHRDVPLFRLLRPYLEKARSEADADDEYVVQRYRGRENLRKIVIALMARAGVNWGRPFQNLRASLATDLVNQFPQHLATAWLGHTKAVAEKSYWTPRPGDFEAAAQWSGTTGGTTGGTASVGSVTHANARSPEETGVSPGNATRPEELKENEYPRVDSNTTGNPRRKHDFRAGVAQRVAQVTLPASLRQLIACWPSLSLDQRQEIVSIALKPAGGRDTATEAGASSSPSARQEAQGGRPVSS